MRRWIIQQVQGRQLPTACGIEQGDLTFFFAALALTHGGRRRFDDRDRAFDHFFGRCSALGFARSPRLFANLNVAALAEPGAHPGDGKPEAMTDAIGHLQPRDMKGQGNAGHPRSDQEQRCTEHLQPTGQSMTHQQPGHTTGGLPQLTRQPMQRRQATAGQQSQDKTSNAHHCIEARTGHDGLTAPAKQQPARNSEHQRQQVGRTPEPEEQQVRQIGAHWTDVVAHGIGTAGE